MVGKTELYILTTKNTMIIRTAKNKPISFLHKIVFPALRLKLCDLKLFKAFLKDWLVEYFLKFCVDALLQPFIEA